MSEFPVIDPVDGLTLTADGRGLEGVYWPTNETAWLYAVLRTTLWQFRGAWKYDQSRGIEYLTKVLGQVADVPVLQAIFREALGRYMKIDRLTVTIEPHPQGEQVNVTFRGPKTLGQDVTISLLENPAIDPLVPILGELYGTELPETNSQLMITMSEELNPEAVPLIGEFEIMGSSETITDVFVEGRQIRLIVSGLITEADLVYRPGEAPLQAVSRTQCEGFRVLIGGSFLLIGEGSGYLSVGAGGSGLIEVLS